MFILEYIFIGVHYVPGVVLGVKHKSVNKTQRNLNYTLIKNTHTYNKTVLLSLNFHSSGESNYPACQMLVIVAMENIG